MTQNKGRTRYAVVGTGGRSWMFIEAIVERFKDSSELVALCDVNQTRMDYYVGKVKEHGVEPPTYKAEDFDRMVEETKPYKVVVTTKDCHHHEYIVRAMELGCDAISEKPMTTHADKCQAILDAQARTGRNVRVTFNYRYAPIRTMGRKVIMDGTIGEVRSVDFNWMLDQRHGADYFRRWHRLKKNSGGLMVHKATHHFDLVNWWIDAHPEEVYAQGSRTFATPLEAKKRGLEGHGERCLDCPVKDRCKFRLDIEAREAMRHLYREAEHEDGYFRDRCIFAEEIEIEDYTSVSVRYDTGAIMTYSLNVFTPWEGYRVAVNGTEGRMEMFVQESSYVSGDGTVPGELKKESYLRVFPLFGEPYDVEIPEAKGGHGGGDLPLLEDVFLADPPEDPYKRAASHIDGAYSIMTGICANESIRTGRPVRVADMVRIPQE